MATTPYDDSPPTVAERYEAATGTSNLTVFGGMVPDGHSSASGDVVLAAGMSQSRTGMALLRLHSEWAALAKPRRPSALVVEAKVAEFKADDALRRSRGTYAPIASPTERAASYFERQMASDLRLLAVGLKSRPKVWEHLGAWAAVKGVSPDTVAAALLHWLSPRCHVCEGHGLRKAPNSPALSARQCHKCHGSGELTRPEGTAKVLNYIDDSCQKARESLSRRLRNG